MMNEKMKVRITKIEAIPFGIPIKRFADAYAEFNTSNAVLVKIYTDDGTVGIGEACAFEPEFYGETLESIYFSIQKYIAPKIIGQNPLNINNVLSIVDATLAKSSCAKEGIDLALFDLVGKLLEVPVYILLGGCFRDKISVACEISINEPDIMIEEAKELLRMGVKTIKIKCSQNIDEDVKRVKAVYEAIGDKVALRLDPNTHWDVYGTVKAIKKLMEFNCNIQYLEQPIPSWDINGMSRIRKLIDIPLMADEGIWTPQDVIELNEHEAVDIVNIKISKTGGLIMAKKIEAISEAMGLPCVVGTELESAISLAAKIHLAASMKNLPFACEYTELYYLKESLLKPKIEIEDGYVKVPKGIGFGVDIDEHVLMKNTIKL